MKIVGKVRLGLVRLSCMIFDLKLICEQIWCRNTDCGARATGFGMVKKWEPNWEAYLLLTVCFYKQMLDANHTNAGGLK